MHFETADTIVALATAPGSAAIAVIRLSGPAAVTIAEKFFHSRALKKISLSGKRPNTVHFGVILHNGEVIDEVLLALFKSPHSYTGQDTIEISCHGSVYIQQRLLSLFLTAGARMADPGEFTFRAFMNGKLDLSQAEAVADLVASTSAISHRTAMKQMRGGFSARIGELRGQLVKFASLVELELDFSEEDVEFADRTQLRQLVTAIIRVLKDLIGSFELGNVIRNGVPVAIVGKPNAGKSTLLNALVGDERAIVSEIAGTTRDTIEDEIVIEGVLFRFIDTAGLRTTGDVIERIGVDRAYEAMGRSAIVIYLFDAHTMSAAELRSGVQALGERTGGAEVVLVANKCDLEDEDALKKEYEDFAGVTYISAKEHRGLGALRSRLLEKFSGSAVEATDTIVTNARHARALANAAGALGRVEEGISKGIPGDLLALDIRYALQELGNITGQVTSDDLLQNIFSKFCIGK